jgi:hypothetical protein
LLSLPFLHDAKQSQGFNLRLLKIGLARASSDVSALVFVPYPHVPSQILDIITLIKRDLPII